MHLGVRRIESKLLVFTTVADELLACTLRTAPARQGHHSPAVHTFWHWFPLLLESRDSPTYGVQRTLREILNPCRVPVENHSMDLKHPVVRQMRLPIRLFEGDRGVYAFWF